METYQLNTASKAGSEAANNLGSSRWLLHMMNFAGLQQVNGSRMEEITAVVQPVARRRLQTVRSVFFRSQ